MRLWETAWAKPPHFRFVFLVFMVFTIYLITTPVFASNIGENIMISDNPEKTLKIRKISFNSDYTVVSVLVDNLVTKTEFSMENTVDTADTGSKYIKITATDGMGGVSETVYVGNPFYVPGGVESISGTESAAEAQSATTIESGGSLNIADAAISKTENGTVLSADTASGNSENGTEFITATDNVSAETSLTTSAAEGDSDSVSDGAFNTDGWGTVVDNAVSGDKEFFIVKSDTGNDFYVVIDRKDGNENVYFLNAVTEWDLLGLTEKYEVPNNLDPNGDLNAIVTADTQNPKEDAEAEKTPEETPEPAPLGGIGIFPIILLVLFVGAVGAYFYFFKLKPKDTVQVKDGALPDDYGNEGDDDEDDGEIADTAEEENDEFDDENEEEAEDEEKNITENTAEKAESQTVDFEKAVNKEDSDGSDDESFMDEDAADGFDEDPDDYSVEVDEEDVLGEDESTDEDEDKTV